MFVNEHRIAELTHLRPEDIIHHDTHLSLSPSVFDLPLPALNQTSNIEPSAKAGPEEVFGVDCENVTPSGKGKALRDHWLCTRCRCDRARVLAFSTGSGSSTEKAAKQASNPDNVAGISPSSGNTAYVASRISDSLTVIDVSNPASPQILGRRHQQIGRSQFSHRSGTYCLRGFT